MTYETALAIFEAINGDDTYIATIVFRVSIRGYAVDVMNRHTGTTVRI